MSEINNTTLVTGVSGFVGHHLTHEMHNNGYKVIGVGLQTEAPAQIKDILDQYIACDLTDEAATMTLPLDRVGSIINLAGLANVGASFDNPDLYKKVNVQVLENICKALEQKDALGTRVLAISTGGVYDQNNPLPQTEESQLFSMDTNNPYIISKLMMEQVALEYRKKGLDCIIVRPFNHIGPGQLPGFLVPDLAEKIQAAKAGDGTLVNRDLERKRRDFTDVRDVARAYRLLATLDSNKLQHEIYNVCSGRSLSAKYILDLLLKEMDATDLKIVVDENWKERSVDPDDIYGDYSRIKTDTGWQPTIPTEQTIKDFVASL
jgi:GDP-4-dehydro-6-deoxy-D-mannose reductase